MPKFPEPYLKYAGRKYKHPAPLSALFKPYRNTHLWVEPFNGANGSVLDVMPTKALLNDANPFLQNLHQWVKTDGVPKIASFFINESEAYYQNRARFNELAKQYPTWGHLKDANDEVREELALLFYYLNKVGFNGLCRFSSKGNFNVPFGSYKKVEWIQDFTPWSPAMTKWSFFSTDWSEFLDYVRFLDEPVTIYADPPYDGANTAFVGYTGKFGWDDQVKLCESLCRFSYPVIASNLATERILELYQDSGFKVWTFPVRRSINSDGKNRKPAIEMLAIRELSEVECGVMDTIEVCAKIK